MIKLLAHIAWSWVSVMFFLATFVYLFGVGQGILFTAIASVIMAQRRR